MIDPEQLIHSWLVSLGIAPDRCGYRLPALSGKDWSDTGFVEYSFIPVGADRNGTTRRHEFQLDCWGVKKNRSGALSPDTLAAWTLCDQIWAAFDGQKLTYAEATIRGERVGVYIEPVMDPSRLPGDPDNYARVTLTVRFTWTQLKEGA